MEKNRYFVEKVLVNRDNAPFSIILLVMYSTSHRIKVIQIETSNSTPILLYSIFLLQHCDLTAQDSLIGAYLHRAVYEIKS